MKQNRSTNLILGGALVILIIAALLLPPIALPQKLATRGMQTIPAATDSNVTDPDGTKVAFPAYGVPDSFKAKITSIPRDGFNNGDGGEAVVAAANALAGLPLIPRSPLYTVETTGGEPTASIITMEIPNESLPYETLDLYQWTGSEWSFLPNHEIMDAGQRARADRVGAGLAPRCISSPKPSWSCRPTPTRRPLPWWCRPASSCPTPAAMP